MGGGTGPFAGTKWAWFGGADFLAPTQPEVGTASQSVTIPAGTASLEFQFEIPVCDSFIDFFDITIDGQLVFAATGNSGLCGQVGYTQQVVNVSAFADGNVHTLELHGETSALLLGATNFMVDDIALIVCL